MGGCSEGSVGEPAEPPQPTTGTGTEASVPMAAMPAGAARICLRRLLLAPACPRDVPESRYGLAGRPIGFEGPYAQGGYAVCLERMRSRCVAEGFHLEGGVPTDDPRTDRPPRFVHLALYAARRPLGRYFPFKLPCTGPEQRDGLDRLLTRRRKAAACLGAATIAGSRGTLSLAPPYPAGGEAGGHLFFLWRDHGITYTATLHAWAPVAEAIDMLRRLVASAPMGKT